MSHPLTYLFRILSQIEDRCYQNARRQRLIENAIREVLHYLPSDFFEIPRGDLGKDCDAREVRVNCQHEFHAEAPR